MKYPRTPHLPQSPGGTNDDKRLQDLSGFRERFLIATEKLDGSNVCLQRDACFARSHAHPPTHPSFDLFKVYHARMKNRIPEYLQVFGEWLYARHSITYTRLVDYLAVFGVRDLRTNVWASWGEVELWAQELGVPTTPFLFEATPATNREGLIERLTRHTSKWGGDSYEGFVLRISDEFHDEDFSRSVAKWVRADHVQTPYHWKTQPMVRNRLASEKVART